MRRSRIRLPLLLSTLTLATLAAGVQATYAQSAQPSAELLIGVRSAFVNEPFVIGVKVSNFQSCEPPVLADIPDCRTIGPDMRGDSTYTRTFGTKTIRTVTRTYTFQLTPLAEGVLEIPPIKVVVDGTEMQTESARVLIKPSDAEDYFSIEVTCPTERLYVGQLTQINLEMWVRVAYAGSTQLDANFMFRLLSFQNPGPFPVAAPRYRYTTKTRKTTDGEDTLFYVYSATAEYAADRPGQLRLDELAIRIAYPKAFDRDWFNELKVADYRYIQPTAKANNIEVLPLPSEGRPTNFTGAVGHYIIAATAEPSRVRVGDPITLTVEISGDGPIASLQAPVLSEDPRLRDGFRVPREELAGEVKNNRKYFSQVIRATRDDLAEIPPIEYPYFDPDRAVYTVARSEPIPIQVSPTAALNTDALIDEHAASDTAGGTVRTLDGLRGIKTHESALLQSRPETSTAALAGVLFTPPVLYAGIALVAAKRRTRTPAGTRRRNALRQARRKLTHAQTLPPRERAAEVAKALSTYLADRCNEPPARFAGRTAVEYLAERAVSVDVRAHWDDVLQRCEAASFGGAENDGEALTHDAEACLNALERERL